MKLRRKLIAAGFAFGATALTLTTSTFAWYTSNTEATVQSVEGMTSSSVDASSFYVAAAKTYNSSSAATAFTEYGSKVQPVAVGTNHVLVPVAWQGKVTHKTGEGTTATTTTDTTFTKYVPMTGTKYVAPSGTSSTVTDLDNTVVYGEYSSSNVLEYVLRFRMANTNSGSTPLYFSTFNLTSSTQNDYKQQVALAYGSTNSRALDTGITESGVYFADLLKSLKLSITVQNLKAVSEGGVDGYGADTSVTATTTVYDLESFATTENSHIGTANAVNYFNLVTNKNISSTADEVTSATKIEKNQTATDTDALSFASIPSSGYVEVRFTFWLDGWDEYCYDVMLQQKFNFDFVATTAAEKSIIKTVTTSNNSGSGQ